MSDGSENKAPKKQKNPRVKLKRNNDSYPILPSLEDLDSYDLLYKKRLIGKFIGDVYG